ncbi:hypothetical protein TRVL_09056 [Trypanosoma vivax]|nr:hypothetical protein TRVL_09056 [Trypanosoma vivax]
MSNFVNYLNFYRHQTQPKPALRCLCASYPPHLCRVGHMLNQRCHSLDHIVARCVPGHLPRFHGSHTVRSELRGLGHYHPYICHHSGQLSILKHIQDSEACTASYASCRCHAGSM